MTDPVDPECHETSALHDLVDFRGKDVLEIGCGDGRMTWRYAEVAAMVLGLDSVDSDIHLAVTNTPDHLVSTITFQVADALSVDLGESAFDVVVLSRSI